MRLDQEGNLYVAAGIMTPRGQHETNDVPPGIYIFSSKGDLLGRIPITEDLITNPLGGPDGRNSSPRARRYFKAAGRHPRQVAYPTWKDS
ncbi:MAG: hypothetical protein U1D30_13200 [Planctomycetota bacterium]